MKKNVFIFSFTAIFLLLLLITSCNDKPDIPSCETEQEVETPDDPDDPNDPDDPDDPNDPDGPDDPSDPDDPGDPNDPDDPDDPTEEPFLTVDETPITATAEAGTYFITVNSNSEWTAVVESSGRSDWCLLDNNTGNGDGVITVSITKNPFYTTRIAIVTISAGSLTKSVVVNQEAAEEPEPPFLTVDETPITATAGAGTYSIVVSSNSEWTAVVEDAENHTWCTLSNNTGNGDGVITVNVTQNAPFTARSATIKITSGNLTKSVVINQSSALENSEWKFYGFIDTAIIELKFLPENRLHIKSTPEQLDWRYIIQGDFITEYRMEGNKMYWPDENGSFDGPFQNQYSWVITHSHENQIIMEFGGIFHIAPPPLMRISTYIFFRQN